MKNREEAGLQSCKVAGRQGDGNTIPPFLHSFIPPFLHSFILSLLLLAGCTLQWVEEPTLTLPQAMPSTPSSTMIPSVDNFVTPMPDPVSNTPISNSVTDNQLWNLSTEEQLTLVIVPTRDLRDLALRLNPDVNEIPQVVNASAPNYAIGDRIEFWAHDLRENSNFQISAELIYKTDVVYAWAEVDQTYDRDKISASLDRFSRRSYPAETALFGTEWNPGIDNDPRMHILHVTRVGSGVAGYYSSADQYSKLANAFSNQKEMFYINLDWLNGSKNYEYYETVLAHELQHMIHWHSDRNEETWVNEGLSEFAQEVADYEPDTIFSQSFADKPDTQLNSWGLTPGQNGEHYGSSYLFIAYFAQQFGTDAIQMLVAHPSNGIEGFRAVLKTVGYPYDFERFFGDWLIANYVDEPNALSSEGTYGYEKLTQDRPLLDATYNSYPQQVKSNVNNYAADYILLQTDPALNQSSLTVEFNGEATTRLIDTSPYSGRYAWWSSRGDDSNTRLTRLFDLRDVDAPVEMDVAMFWAIEQNYDYGYALASLDGQKWDILAGQRTTADNPSGNSFGLGYTGRSTQNRGNSEEYASEWVTERFDLSPYAGKQVWIRFEYVTDDAVSDSGWLIDDIRIPQLGYEANFEQGMDSWESEGWLLTDNLLTQRWLLQVLKLDEEERLQAVERVPVNDQGEVVFQIQDMLPEWTAVLTVSALAPVTTEMARYEMRISQSESP